MLFDEFHERSLDADLGLALALDAQAGLREDLRLLVMSATLDGARVARCSASLLTTAPLIESAGRAFPVETRHLGRDPASRIEDQVASATLAALASERGSILVFLPGQGEIAASRRRSRARVRVAAVDIAPLYGALDARAQDRAIAPAPARPTQDRARHLDRRDLADHRRRARRRRFRAHARSALRAGLGLTRLETVRVSRANADQRRGRAGRVEPGVCYRLWEEAATGGLAALRRARDPRRRSLRLRARSRAVGRLRPREPRLSRSAAARRARRGACAAARLGALDADARVTDEGRAIAELALPPRLARMLVDAAREGAATTRARDRDVLSERGLGGDAVDLAKRLAAFRRDRSPRAEDARRLARGAGAAGGEPSPLDPLPEGEAGAHPLSRESGRRGRIVGLLLARPIPSASPARAAGAANS